MLELAAMDSTFTTSVLCSIGAFSISVAFLRRRKTQENPAESQALKPDHLQFRRELPPLTGDQAYSSRVSIVTQSVRDIGAQKQLDLPNRSSMHPISPKTSIQVPCAISVLAFQENGPERREPNVKPTSRLQLSDLADRRTESPGEDLHLLHRTSTFKRNNATRLGSHS